MTFAKTLVAAAAMTLAVGLTPALAQRHGGGGGGAHSRGGGGGAAGAGRAVARPSISGPRSGPGIAGPRSGPVIGHAVPRGSYPGVAGGGYGYYRPYSNYGYSNYGYSYYRPYSFYRPYYSFRPRFSIGFGLWAGFPITYPYYYGYYNPFYSPYGYAYAYPYPYSYGYSYPYSYGYPSYGYPSYGYPNYGYPGYSDPSSAPAYPPQGGSSYPPSTSYPQSGGSATVQPGQPGPDQSNMGGVSFEITPSTAQIYVDGSFVGTVGQFTPTTQPLGLTAGRHHLEIKATGYRTMEFDADIVAGQVIPYQGTLQR